MALKPKQLDDARLVPGYGGKYILRSDGTLWRRSPTGKYLKVSVCDGRVRLYHLGTESRRSLDAMMREVFPEGYGWTEAEILDHDREVPPGGGVGSRPGALPDKRDLLGDELQTILNGGDDVSVELPGENATPVARLPEL